jgi:F-type H+-transporting ATPase subunit b
MTAQRIRGFGRRAALLLLATGVMAFAQESHEPPKSHEPAKAVEHGEPAKHEAGGEAAGHGGGGGHAGLEGWKWANFAILAIGLGYLINKNGGPFFAARSQQIRQDMVESQEARRQAEARAADVDRRLAALDTEIAALRAESQREMQAEAERLSRHTATEIAKIKAHAEQEIVSAGKAARTDLKRYSAGLAIGLAEERLRARMTTETQQALVRGFVRDLNPSAPRAAK